MRAKIKQRGMKTENKNRRKQESNYGSGNFTAANSQNIP
jgi:hypothetical protein